MKTVTAKQLAAIKRVAMNVYPTYDKMQKVEDKMRELQAKYDELKNQIDLDEMGVKTMTGYSVMDLIDKVSDTTPTKYVPSDMLKFNEETKVYEIIDAPEVEIIKESNTFEFNTNTENNEF